MADEVKTPQTELRLWNLIKTTLIEKDGTNTIYGSIKRWAGWLLLYCVVAQVMVSLMPTGSLNWGWLGLHLEWHHSACKVDMNVLTALLQAIGTYILTGAAITAVANTIQHYNEVKNAK